MATPFDESDFVDRDYEESQQQVQSSVVPPPGPTKAQSAPTREQLSAKVTETQKKLAELRQVQEDLERERTQLEESRRRQNEFVTGREEVLTQLTRGVELLKEAEQDARRDAEQMAKTLGDLTGSLEKVSGIDEESWTPDNYNVRLTKALALIENARMEWNGANQKWPSVLKARLPDDDDFIRLEGSDHHLLAGLPLTGQNLRYLCKLGLAHTWPLALVALLALIAFLVVSFK